MDARYLPQPPSNLARAFLDRPGTQAQRYSQYVLVANALLGGAVAADGGINDNPNPEFPRVGRYVRIFPLAGAASYPILLVMGDGKQRQVWDSSPFDTENQSFRVKPRTFADAFGVGADALSDANVTRLLFPKPTWTAQFVAGSILNSAGYVGGFFGIEGADSPFAFGSAPGPVPPFTYSGSVMIKLATPTPSNILPIPLPEFINRGTNGIAIGGIDAVNCVFLGAGEGKIRHIFTAGSGWTGAHALNKWYLDPLSLSWLPAGVLNIGPGVAPGSVAVVEESINLALPTWYFLQLDAADLGGDVLWTSVVTRGSR